VGSDFKKTVIQAIKEKKKIWLTQIVVLVLIFLTILILSQSDTLSRFVYVSF